MRKCGSCKDIDLIEKKEKKCEKVIIFFISFRWINF